MPTKFQFPRNLAFSITQISRVDFLMLKRANTTNFGLFLLAQYDTNFLLRSQRDGKCSATCGKLQISSIHSSNRTIGSERRGVSFGFGVGFN
jgi:hypothetical protein